MSKKSIIAIITIIVLLFAAGLSVGVFLSGRGETEASDGNQVATGNQTSDENQVADGNQENENVVTNPDSEDEEVTIPDEGNTENNDAENNEDATENGNVENETANNNAENNNAGATTGTIVDEVGETTITRVEEQERLVSKDFWDWWEPAEVKVAATTPNMRIVTPDIGVQKRVIKTETGDLNLTYVNQEITYEIKITNNTDKDLNNIEVKDRIPENTTFVSVEDNGTPVTQKTENGEEKVAGVKWVLSIPGHKEDEEPNFVTVKFTVKVNATKLVETEDGEFEEVDVEGTITNKAIANGEESNETKTSIIKTRKSSVINNDETVQIAKKDDLITYTITVTNTGTETGIVDISDSAPKGTTLISAEGLEIEEGQTTVEWKQVELPAGEEITKYFVVRINEIDREIRNVATVSDKETNEDVIKTAAIDVEKTIARIKRVVEGVDTYLDLEDKELAVIEGDVIEYQITVTNIGSEDLTNVLLEEKLKDATITGITVAVDGQQEQQKALEYKEENDGTKKLKIGYLNAVKDATEEQPAIPAGVATITATYTVTHENDIYQKPAQLIKNEVIATGETIPEPGKDPVIVDDNDDAEVPVAPTPEITIVKTATRVKKAGETTYSAITEKVRPGDVVEYTITVTNTGNTTLTNIKVTDTLNVRVDTDDVKVAPITAGNVIKAIETLSPNDEPVIIKTYYTVSQSDMTVSETINNVATAVADGGITDDDDEIVPVNPNITLSGNKIWVLPTDSDLQVPIPPITVRLYLGNQPYKHNGEDVKTVLMPGESTYYSFGNLPKYTATLENGEIKYTENNYSVKEDEVVGFNVKYDDPITKNGNNWVQNITNTSKQTKITFKVDKKWIDEGTTEVINKRPQVKVQLYKNGTAYGEPKTLVNDKCEFPGLPKYTITTADNGTITYTENIYTVQELAVEGYEQYSKTNVTNTTTTFTNIIKQGTTSIKATKVWNIPEGMKGTTPIKIYVYQNNNKMNDKFIELTYNGTKTVPHEFKDLPKYQTNADGSLKVQNGRVVLNKYSVKEEANSQYIATQSGNTITNNAKVIVEEITTQTTNNPIDVVFVLDISGSMKYDGKGDAMVSAVNNTIDTIKKHNSNSRAGIVTFSTVGLGGNNADIVCELTNINNIKQLGGGSTSITYNGKTIPFYNATYTQAGIEKGGEMLANAQPPAGSKTLEGRTPILILLTDGEPTYHCTTYKDIAATGTSDEEVVYGYADSTGPGWHTTPKNVYYTIKTANYWRGEIEDNYGVSNFFTIGLGRDSLAMRAVLDPTETNIKAYNATETYNYQFSGYNQLSKYFETDKNEPLDIKKSDYSDATYINAQVDEAKIKEHLDKFITQSHTTNKKMPEVNSNNEVVLTNVDTSKEFTLTCGNTDYTLQTAKTAGLIKVEGTTCTVYLNKTGTNKVSIKYYKK